MCILYGSYGLSDFRTVHRESGVGVLLAGSCSFVGEELNDNTSKVLRTGLEVYEYPWTVRWIRHC